MRLAIDVGNSETKVGIFDDGSFAAVWRCPSGSGDFHSWLHAQFLQSGLTEAITQAGGVSVVPAAEEGIASAVKEQFGLQVQWLRWNNQNALQIHYDPPEALGPDRIANCIGAIREFKAPLAVVDLGSATTIDVVVEGTFVGGAILPGLGMQMVALHQETAQLPAVPLEAPPHALATSTMEAMQSGIVLGHAGSIEGILRRIEQELGQPLTVIGTGGYAHLMIGATEAIGHFVPHLTLEGVVAATG